jgi:hypothetical protein
MERRNTYLILKTNIERYFKIIFIKIGSGIQNLLRRDK